MKPVNLLLNSFLLVFSSLLLPVYGQQPEADLIFHPNYQLSGRAANYPGPKIDGPASQLATIDQLGEPLLLRGQTPTERRINLLRDSLPEGPFTVEFWLLMHVNRPVGALAAAREREGIAKADWLLGYFGNRLVFGLRPEGSDSLISVEAQPDRGWKRYWLQVVGVYDGQNMRLYFNGTLKGQQSAGPRAKSKPGTALELATYTAYEPFMSLPNLIKRCRIYNYALTEAQIQQKLKEQQQLVESGHLFPGLFHFTAGPYLHFVTPASINLSWETDRRVKKAVVRYGEKLPLDQEKVIDKYSDPEIAPDHFIQTTTIAGLKPATNYFYELVLSDEQGNEIKSGVLTFATAPAAQTPFTFAIIGDTEARPHINYRVAELIWDERPNFLVNLGDLTDGGQQAHKFEWTHEYFTGMTPLTSRIPIFPVAGNGESDLYWYNRYHKLPDPEGYYSFTYGNAEFFMLNSNKAATDFAPGGEQYRWLEEQLKRSTATWKFVCHHHAPYSSDEDDYGNSWEGPTDLGDLKVRQIVPLYEKYGVDIVFFGHLHTYQRTLPILENSVNKRNGVIYLQGGGGGGNLEDFAPTRSWFSAKTYRGHHYFTVSIEDRELNLRMFDTEGRMRDFLTKTK